MSVKNGIIAAFQVCLLAGALLGGLSSASHAAPASCNVNSCTDEIDRIYVSGSGGVGTVYVSIEDRPLAASHLNCAMVSGWYFTLKPSHPMFGAIYELMLAAKSRSTGEGRNRITFRMIDNSPICEIVYAVVDWPN